MDLLTFCFLAGKAFTLAIGGYYFRYLSSSYRSILCLVAVALFFESYGHYIAHFLHKENIWLFNCYLPIEVCLMGIPVIFLTANQRLRYFFFLLIFIDFIVWIFDIYTYSIYSFANAAMIFGSVSLFGMYLFLFFTKTLFKGANTFSQPLFWLCTSTLLYFGCDIPYMGLRNYLIAHSPSLATQFVYINVILDIIRYPLIAISFLLLGRQRQSEVNTA